MKLATEDFARITAACARIADERHAVPAFRNVHLAASDGMLTAMASNGEYWLTLRAPCDGDLAPILAPAGKLADAVGKLVADNVDVTVDGAALHIKAKGSKRKLQVMASDAFPQPEVDRGQSLSVDVARLLECFAFCVPFANDDQTQPSLSGVHLSVRDGQLRAAATDGNAVVECVYGEAEPIEPATVPTGFATEVGKLGIATDAMLVFSERKVRIEWAEGRLIAPRVTGAFPQYERIIPASPTSSAELPADDIARSCAGVRPFGTHVGKFGTVLAISASDDGIELMARTGEGEAVDTLNASLNGDIPTFGLSSAYLEKACKGFGNAKVRIKITSATSPVLIDSEEKTDRLAVIMPRRI